MRKWIIIRGIPLTREKEHRTEEDEVWVIFQGIRLTRDELWKLLKQQRTTRIEELDFSEYIEQEKKEATRKARKTSPLTRQQKEHIDRPTITSFADLALNIPVMRWILIRALARSIACSRHQSLLQKHLHDDPADVHRILDVLKEMDKCSSCLNTLTQKPEDMNHKLEAELITAFVEALMRKAFGVRTVEWIPSPKGTGGTLIIEYPRDPEDPSQGVETYRVSVQNRIQLIARIYAFLEREASRFLPILLKHLQESRQTSRKKLRKGRHPSSSRGK